MSIPQSGKASRIGWLDVFALSFWGCLILVLYSIIPLLTIIAGFLTIKRGLIFWGAAIIVLGMMALVGPFYAASRSKAEDEKPSEKASGG